MALADEVKARFETQWLISLTNKDSPTATAINDTNLGYAVTDVTGEFKTQQVGTYDNSNAQHVAVAIEGVIARLKTFARTGGVGGSKWDEWENWVEKRCAPLAKSTGRRRIDPDTSTETTPSDELPEGVTIRRPWADRRRFIQFQVNPPHRQDDYDNDDA